MKKFFILLSLIILLYFGCSKITTQQFTIKPTIPEGVSLEKITLSIFNKGKMECKNLFEHIDINKQGKCHSISGNTPLECSEFTPSSGGNIEGIEGKEDRLILIEGWEQNKIIAIGCTTISSTQKEKESKIEILPIPQFTEISPDEVGICEKVTVKGKRFTSKNLENIKLNGVLITPEISSLEEFSFYTPNISRDKAILTTDKTKLFGIEITSSEINILPKIPVDQSAPADKKCPYKNIQDAINLSQDGDTIYVTPTEAPYNEALTINKDITIIGTDNKNKTRLTSKEGSIITIAGSSVNIQGFQIENPFEYGIYIKESLINESLIKDNIILNSGLFAINIESSNVKIEGNEIRNPDIEYGGGIRVTNNSLCTITQNSIENLYEYGIYVENSYVNISNNKYIRNIKQNQKKEFGHGIYIKGISSNPSSIELNGEISNNEGNGIVIDSANINIKDNKRITGNYYGIEILNIGELLSTIVSGNEIKNNFYGIFVKNSKNVKIGKIGTDDKINIISNNNGVGIIVEESFITIDGNIIDNNDNWGINCRKSKCDISNNSITNTKATDESESGTGVRIQESYEKSSIKFNRISENDREGIDVVSSLVDITSNDSKNYKDGGIYNNKNQGITISKLEGNPYSVVSISGNEIKENQKGGVGIKNNITETTEKVKIDSNIIDSNLQYGIGIVNSSNCEITNNEIKNSKNTENNGFGIYISESENILINKTNKINFNEYIGVRILNYCKNVTIQDNEITNNKDTGISIGNKDKTNDNSEAKIYNNDIDKNSGSGILLKSISQVYFSGNSGLENERYGIECDTGSNPNIKECKDNCNLKGKLGYTNEQCAEICYTKCQ